MDKLPIYAVTVAADGFAYVELPGPEPSLALTPAYAAASDGATSVGLYTRIYIFTNRKR